MNGVKVLMTGGGKGGTGKSMASMSAISWALAKGINVAVFDGDFENTDVLKPAEKHVDAISVDLRKEDGWIDVANGIESSAGGLIVVNQPAGATVSTIANEHMIRAVLAARGGTGTIATVLNRQRDSVEILKKLIDSLEETYESEGDSAVKWRVVAVRNLYWGNEDKFSRFNSSAQAKRVAATVNFPELHDIVTDKLIDNRLLPGDIDAATKNGAPIFSIAERSILSKFGREAAVSLSRIFGDT